MNTNQIILFPAHFNSLERKVLELHKFNPNFKIPFISKMNTFKMNQQNLFLAFKDLKELNVLCQFFIHRTLFEGELDFYIKTYKEMLFEDSISSKELSNWVLYNTLLTLKKLLDTSSYEEVFKLSQNQKNALYFLEELINNTAHYLLSFKEIESSKIHYIY